MAARILLIISAEQALALGAAATHYDACNELTGDNEAAETARQQILAMADVIFTSSGQSDEELGSLGLYLTALGRKHL